ncbi:MAG TPA: ABC transporter permease [Rhodocyclaceae bacterium]|nr:ABC transporter permease [Rhodocyclaceae bacterium]
MNPVAGCAEVLLHVTWRSGQLARPQLRVYLLRQVSAAGIDVMPLLALLAVIGGTGVLVGTAQLLGLDNQLGLQASLIFLWLEFAPLLAALVLVARSSGLMAAEVALMRLHNEFESLERLHIPPRDFVLLPRVLGAGVAAAVTTAWMQVLSLGGGLVLGSALHGFSAAEQGDRILDLAQPWFIAAGVAKAFAFGLLSAAVACHQGLHAPRVPGAGPNAAMVAVGQGVAAVFLFDAFCGVVTYLLMRSSG